MLLNLYRYTDQTCGELTSLMERLKDRLWLPHQAGLEFHENRLVVISEQANSYAKIAEE